MTHHRGLGPLVPSLDHRLPRFLEVMEVSLILAFHSMGTATILRLQMHYLL